MARKYKPRKPIHWLIQYTIDGEDYFIQHISKTSLNQNRKAKIGRRLFFEDRNIKMRFKEMDPDLMTLADIDNVS